MSLFATTTLIPMRAPLNFLVLNSRKYPDLRAYKTAEVETSALAIKLLASGFERAIEEGDAEAALLALDLLEREIVVQRVALQLAGTPDA